MEKLEGLTFLEPFPHLIINNFYNDEELELIWEELKFYTKPGKFLPAKDYVGIEGYTDAKALCLDNIYTTGDPNYRSISNILTVNRKVFDASVLQSFSDIHDCCGLASLSNYDITKVRYYHNGDYYDPHIDKSIQFLQESGLDEITPAELNTGEGKVKFRNAMTGSAYKKFGQNFVVQSYLLLV